VCTWSLTSLRIEVSDQVHTLFRQNSSHRFTTACSCYRHHSGPSSRALVHNSTRRCVL